MSSRNPWRRTTAIRDAPTTTFSRGSSLRFVCLSPRVCYSRTSPVVYPTQPHPAGSVAFCNARDHPSHRARHARLQPRSTGDK